MPDLSSTVFIVDDDPDLRDSLDFLLTSLSIPTKTYATAGEFLAEYDLSLSGCLVSDVRMPDMSGLDLYAHLCQLGSQIPVILMTAYADVPMAIRALKSGIVDFIEKPFNAHEMLERIQRALAQEQKRRASSAEWDEFRKSMLELTDKEREILNLLIAGTSNKVMATQLNISERSVEMRRSSLMKRLKVASLAELIRRVTQFELLFPNLRNPEDFHATPR